LFPAVFKTGRLTLEKTSVGRRILMTFFSATVLLFLVIDPFGNIPLFLSILKNVEVEKHKKIIIRELLIAVAILILFFFTGKYILEYLDISEPSLSIAGGIVLFLIAIRMIFPGEEKLFGDSPEGEPLIVPLAIPFIAGPSAIATVLLLMAREPGRWPIWLTALFCAWGSSGIILIFSDHISKLVGVRVLGAIERLMGMLLTMVAVEMFIKGARQLAFLYTAL
jgi:multiple antibiotic resistance protein